MEKADLFSPEFLSKITELGFQGYHAIGRGAVFMLQNYDDPLFYIKQKYVTEVKAVNDEQKNLMIEHVEKYEPRTEIIVFYFEEIVLLDIFKETGKTLDDYAPINKPNNLKKNPKKIIYQKK